MNPLLYATIVSSVTNILPLIPIITLVTFLVVLLRKGVRVVTRVEVAILVVLSYLVLNVLIMYESFDGFDLYGFLRRDGKILIPLLFMLAVLFIARNYSNQYRNTFTGSIVILNVTNLFVFCWFMFLGIPSDIYTQENVSEDIYRLFFNAHNAAATYLLMLFAINFHMGFKPSYFWLFQLVLLFSIFYSDSRGALLGLAVLIVVIIFRAKFIRLGVLSIVTGIFFGFIAIYSDIGSQISTMNSSREGTIYERLDYFYPKAISLAVGNPILGVGLGRYDDENEILHTDQHSHNSILHILAELGVIGFFLILMLFSVFYRSLPVESAKAFTVVAMPLFVTSLTEHTLVSLVSVSLPILFYAYLYTKNKRN